MIKNELLEINVNELKLSEIINLDLKNNSIFTIEDLLIFTGGDFTVIRRVGRKTQKKIEVKINQMGIDVNKFFEGSVYNLKLPLTLKRIFVSNDNFYIESIYNLKYKNMVDMFGKDALKVVEDLKKAGISLSLGDTIYDTELSSQIKNAMFKSGYIFLHQAYEVNEERFLKMRNLGKGYLAEFKSWKEKNDVQIR